MGDVIAAIATPPGRGAIGIVRMSGTGSRDILGRVWKSQTHSVDKFVTHRLYLGKIVDFSTGGIIDEALAVMMNAPDSYTGEDVVEINCHGGPVVLRRVLDQLIQAGARPAEPGEFTKRAFLNGKMDLVQAEAVASLIDSRSEMALKVAGEQLEGRLSKEIGEIGERLKKLLAFAEASIDFPDEDTEFIKRSDMESGLKGMISDIERLISSFDRGMVIREGVKTVIAGPPNAGKSSLLNALLGRERAIVHRIPGTTRDTIEEEVLIGGISFRLVDTAGIREAEAEVEEIGISRTMDAARKAEVVIVVLDGHEFSEVEPRFIEELKTVRHVIVAVNKKDLGLNINIKGIEKLFGNRPVLAISARRGDGLDELIGRLTQEVSGPQGLQETEGTLITSRRHFSLLEGARDNLKNTLKSVEHNESMEFAAHHIRQGMEGLGKITGEVTNEEILSEIFRSFCIGK